MGPKVAIPIGAVTVLGGALSSTCINMQRRHPLADRPLIDWDFILVMQPVVLIGVSLGTFIHQKLSEQVLIVLLVILLSATAHSTLSKAMRMYEAEKRYIRHLKASQAENTTGSPSRTFTWGDGELHTMKPTKNLVDEEEKERILIENPDFVTIRSDLIEEEKFTPNSKSKCDIEQCTRLRVEYTFSHFLFSSHGRCLRHFGSHYSECYGRRRGFWKSVGDNMRVHCVLGDSCYHAGLPHGCRLVCSSIFDCTPRDKEHCSLRLRAWRYSVEQAGWLALSK